MGWWKGMFSLCVVEGGKMAYGRFVPFVGMVTIWMNEIKWIKYSVIGGLGLLAILQREG